MKHLKTLLAVLMGALALTACSDDGEITVVGPTASDTLPNAYVLNQGSYYNGIDGTLDALLPDGSYTASLFSNVNGQSLGDSPQNGVVYGSHLYIPMYGSNLLWVLDAATLRIVTSIATNSPEWVCAAGGAVFVSNNDGYVSRIDTLSMSVTTKVAVGPNPAQMTSRGDSVYVSISDGYNWSGGCADGKRVAVIDATTGKVTRSLPCGVNPGLLAATADGTLYVVARGTYEGAVVQQIAADGTTTTLCDGSIIALSGNTLYVINVTTDWTTYTTALTFKSYDATTGALISDDFLATTADEERPPYPNALSIDPTTGDLYICSDRSASDYDKTGYVYVYHADGSFVSRREVGIHPCDVIFRR